MKVDDKPAGGAAAPADETAPDDRGEISLSLGGEQLGLRPTYEAIDAIEKALGRGLVDVARDAVTGRLTTAELAQVACECIRAWGAEAGNRGAAAANAPRIARLIIDSDLGIYGAMKATSGMLSLAVTGGYDSAGNRKPVTMTTSGAPVAG